MRADRAGLAVGRCVEMQTDTATGLDVMATIPSLADQDSDG